MLLLPYCYVTVLAQRSTYLIRECSTYDMKTTLVYILLPMLCLMASLLSHAQDTSEPDAYQQQTGIFFMVESARPSVHKLNLLSLNIGIKTQSMPEAGLPFCQFINRFSKRQYPESTEPVAIPASVFRFRNARVQTLLPLVFYSQKNAVFRQIDH